MSEVGPRMGGKPERFIDSSDTEAFRDRFMLVTALDNSVFRNLLISNESLPEHHPAAYIIARKRESPQSTKAYETGVLFAKYMHHSLVDGIPGYLMPLIIPRGNNEDNRIVNQYLKHGKPVNDEELRQRQIDFYGEDFERSIEYFCNIAKHTITDLVWEGTGDVRAGYYDYLAVVTMLESPDPIEAQRIARASADNVSLPDSNGFPIKIS